VRHFLRLAGVYLIAAVATIETVSAQSVFDTTAFSALHWREIGPFRGGRSVAVAGSGARPNEYYMGTTGGGVYKTTDGGLTWKAATDPFFGGTIGAIGVSESNPDVVYVGTGEYPIRGNVSHGDGVYKSTDGGKTWVYVGLADTRQISRVKVHPKNPDVVYVGAMGHVYAPNSARGVYRTADGGKTWKRILFRNDSTGVTDLVMDPSDPNTLYAAFWQAGRKPWQLSSGGTGSGIFKTTDGGETWKELTRNKGLPAGIVGNIGISVSPGATHRVYAIVEADSGGVFRSEDAGATWTKVNGERKLRQRAWYYSRIFADPKDTNTVYVLNVSFWRSKDGGRTWKVIRTPHGDNHDLWIAPNDPMRMIEGNDGGANVSTNAGDSWTNQEYATAQFYHVSTTNHFPYWVCGTQQDNSSLCGPSRMPGGIDIGDWKDGGGCESGYITARPDHPDIVFAGCYGGLLTRTDLTTGAQRDVSPWPLNPLGHASEDHKYRFQWTYPIVISPHDPNQLYVGGNVIFQSTDEGQSWKIISPDLTRHDPKTLGPSGGPITKDHTGVETYATVFTIAESPKEKGVIWSGSDDGLIYITRNGGQSWTNVTPKDIGDFTRISMIEASPHEAGTAYVAANRYQLDDFRPYIYRTQDYGQTWKRIDSGISATEFIRVVREDPERKGLLFAGTERGVWVSFDDGAHWQRLQRNLPPVAVHDLQIKEGDLVAGTHGRSFWILDDITPLRELSAEAVAKPTYLFTPRPSYRIDWGSNYPRGSRPTGANPPSGATIRYWLKDKEQKVKLEFLDQAGNVIDDFRSEPDSFAIVDSLRNVARLDSLRNLGVIPASVDTNVIRQVNPEDEETPRRPTRPPRLPANQGLNTFTWDLHYPAAVWFSRMVLWSGVTPGPVVLPGTYQVRLTVGGASETRTFTVKKDPRTTATEGDLKEQFDLLLKIRDKVSDANNGVRTIRNVRDQLDARQAKIPSGKGGNLAKLSGPFLNRIAAIEGELYQVRNRSSQDMLNYPIKLNEQLGVLYFTVASVEAKPTAQSMEVFGILSDSVDRQLKALKQALDGDLPKINAELSRLGAEAITPSTAELSPGGGGGGGGDEEGEGEEEERGREGW
jgi:photosystem II stability/assembly factor-like uncharacterized protein